MLCVILPILFPIVMELGYDPIWFGILSVTAAELGLITPPLGLNVYVVNAAAGPDTSLEDVFRGVIPFFIMGVFFTSILIAFPQVATFLPNTMLSVK